MVKNEAINPRYIDCYNCGDKSWVSGYNPYCTRTAANMANTVAKNTDNIIVENRSKLLPFAGAPLTACVLLVPFETNGVGTGAGASLVTLVML